MPLCCSHTALQCGFCNGATLKNHMLQGWFSSLHRGFFSGFLLLQKPTLLKSDLESVGSEEPLCGRCHCKIPFIFPFIYLFLFVRNKNYLYCCSGVRALFPPAVYCFGDYGVPSFLKFPKFLELCLIIIKVYSRSCI